MSPFDNLLFLSSVREEAFIQLGALIIILRLWRVVRIVNGTYCHTLVIIIIIN